LQGSAYVCMPCCTGDLQIGTATHVYDAGAGPVTIEHHGGRNAEQYLERLVSTFPYEWDHAGPWATLRPLFRSGVRLWRSVL